MIREPSPDLFVLGQLVEARAFSAGVQHVDVAVDFRQRSVQAAGALKGTVGFRLRHGDDSDGYKAPRHLADVSADIFFFFEDAAFQGFWFNRLIIEVNSAMTSTNRGLSFLTIMVA